MAKETKKPDTKKGKPVDDKAAKKAARMERLKNRPEGQRENSKQIDVIPFDGGQIQVFAAPVRKYGCIITAIALDSEGQPVSVSVSHLGGFKPKSKKGHGSLVLGIPGVKKGKGEDESEEEEEEQPEEQQPKGKKSGKAGKKRGED